MEKLLIVKEKINKLNSVVNSLDNVNISLIEKDVLLQSVRELYIDLSSLATSEKSLNTIVEKNIINTEKPKIVETVKPVEEPIEFVEEVIETPIPEEKPKVVEIPKPVVESKPTETAIEYEPQEHQQTNLFGTKQKKPVAQTLGEQLGQNKKSLNDQLASQKQTSNVSSRIGLKPVSDIKAAIGIGDRFLYIRELFNGNNDIFEETIIHLNSLTSFDDAKSFIEGNFNWNLSDETPIAFVNVVKRKYL